MDVFDAAAVFQRHGWRLRQAQNIPGEGARAALDAPDGSTWGITKAEGERGLTVTCGGEWFAATLPGLTPAQVADIARANG